MHLMISFLKQKECIVQTASSAFLHFISVPHSKMKGNIQLKSLFPVGRGRQRKPHCTWPLAILYKSEQLTSAQCLNKDMQEK